MRHLAITTGLAVFLGGAGAFAQTSAPSAPPAGGPYILVKSTHEQLTLLSVPSRAASGSTATVTLVSLMNPPGGAPRIDVALEFDCARGASRKAAVAIRDMQGAVVRTMMSSDRSWIVAGPGEQDQKVLTFACRGTFAGPTPPNIDQISRIWRAQVARP